MSIPILGYVYFVSSLVPLSVGLVRYRSIARPMKILTLLCVLSFVNAATQFILGRLKISNQFIGNAFVPVEVLLIILIYFFSTGLSKYRRIVVGSGILFMLVWIIDKLFFEIPNQINPEMAVVSRLFLVAMSLLMISVASGVEIPRLRDKSVFWVAAGVILYSTGTFLAVGLGNRLLEMNVSFFIIVWHINWSLLIVANLLYTKGLLCKSQT